MPVIPAKAGIHSLFSQRFNIPTIAFAEQQLNRAVSIYDVGNNHSVISYFSFRMNYFFDVLSSIPKVTFPLFL